MYLTKEMYGISAFTGKKIKYIRPLERFVHWNEFFSKSRIFAIFSSFLDFFENDAEIRIFADFKKTKKYLQNVIGDL